MNHDVSIAQVQWTQRAKCTRTWTLRCENSSRVSKTYSELIELSIEFFDYSSNISCLATWNEIVWRFSSTSDWRLTKQWFEKSRTLSNCFDWLTNGQRWIINRYQLVSLPLCVNCGRHRTALCSLDADIQLAVMDKDFSRKRYQHNSGYNYNAGESMSINIVNCLKRQISRVSNQALRYSIAV